MRHRERVIRPGTFASLFMGLVMALMGAVFAVVGWHLMHSSSSQACDDDSENCHTIGASATHHRGLFFAGVGVLIALLGLYLIVVWLVQTTVGISLFGRQLLRRGQPKMVYPSWTGPSWAPTGQQAAGQLPEQMMPPALPPQTLTPIAPSSAMTILPLGPGGAPTGRTIPTDSPIGSWATPPRDDSA